MHKQLASVLLLSALLFSLPAAAFTPVQHETISRLGELNGVALHCGYLSDMRRLKEALANYVPKVRQLGEYFEDETRKSFQRMVGKNLPCPAPEPFQTEVNGAITALIKAYATRP